MAKINGDKNPKPAEWSKKGQGRISESRHQLGTWKGGREGGRAWECDAEGLSRVASRRNGISSAIKASGPRRNAFP